MQFIHDNYMAAPEPRPVQGVRVRPSFESAKAITGATHLCTRGQAGLAQVVAFCGAVLSGAIVSRDVDGWISCDRCRHLRLVRQRWTYV